MALENVQAAWVNRSSSTIPVYQGIGDFGAGHFTAGGTQIGSIYPNEMYTTRYRDNYLTYYEIRFRNSSGNMTTGYIETLPQGYTYPEAAWVASQELYHYFNSNGSTLTTSATVSLDGVTYRKFTVNSAVTYRNPSGTSQGTLPVGALLLTDQSTTGSTYPGYMLFKKVSYTGGTTYGSWADLTSSGYGFVDLGLSLGSMPSNRPIR